MTPLRADFGVSVSLDAQPTTVAVSGEIDILTAPALAATLHGLINHGRPALVVDLSAVTFFDGRGISAIAAVAARARQTGTTVVVRSPTAFVRHLLEITETTDLVVIEDAHNGGHHPAHLLEDHAAPAGTPPVSRPATRPRSVVDLVDASLQLVAALADATVTHNAGVSVTLERYGELVTIAASTERVIAVDHHQYDTGQGPCLDAARQDRSFYVESLAQETRWPAFVPLALQHGIRSILSSPLKAHNRSLGSLNVYAAVERAFGPHERRLAALFVDQASRVLTSADHDTTDQQWDERFAAALGGRRTIHQAQAIILARNDISADHALARLMQTARARDVTALAHATEIVDSLRDHRPRDHDGATP